MSSTSWSRLGGPMTFLSWRTLITQVSITDEALIAKASRIPRYQNLFQGCLFIWEAIREKILTVDQVMKREWALVNMCYFCWVKELASHILVHGPKAWKLETLF
ncbi:hypothetical protein CK203_045818 [Vitis vinifera]|uniref:Reverse transcriptase zinc-binding domain-containing protein n=1 Tax=Vitis vinifera TaxID=29760 RepID=A0A438FM99_VITVI|nr:hypothetical protein CK203_045818 [Vitis vinifera]